MTTGDTDATASDAKALAIRAVQLMATGTLADFEDVVHPDMFNRESIDEPPSCRGRGPAAIYASALWLRAAYDDLDWEVHDAVAEDDTVVLHTTMSGRQTGTFVAYDAQGLPTQAFPATGNRFATTQTHWFRFADGLPIEHWANRDDLGTATQLGWVPPTPAYLIRMRLATSRARKDARQVP